MYSIDQVVSTLEKYAPLSISKKLIEHGEYDNSGIIVNSHKNIGKILFSLDLSLEAIKKAKRLKCDTIITHHPAIYYPIKSLSEDDFVSNSILKAIENKLNVISMHLNLDLAEKGIDTFLCKGLGGEKFKRIDFIDEKNGYGKEFSISPIKFSTYISKVKKEFSTNRVITYGNKNDLVKSVASFCGGGAGFAEKYIKEGRVSADLIVTSDMSHHIIKEFVESDKKIMLLTHYASEVYGFKKFYDIIEKELQGICQCEFFLDKRFI